MNVMLTFAGVSPNSISSPRSATAAVAINPVHTGNTANPTAMPTIRAGRPDHRSIPNANAMIQNATPSPPPSPR
jgi:hypothetical protein